MLRNLGSLLPVPRLRPTFRPPLARGRVSTRGATRERLLRCALARAAIVTLTLLAATSRAQVDSAPVIDFARDIQPLLANRCYDCHGAEKPKGGLRLNTRANALQGGESGSPALIPGHGATSPLIQRLTTTDPDDVMPQKGDRLSPAEINRLRQWIDAGAVWPENSTHWAYVPPVRPPVPPARHAAATIRNPIDAFVFARLEPAHLLPAAPADRARWLRRVSLDLTGLPPTPSEAAAFIADPSPQADERVVDRLLATPTYGERWARPWLDLARYADSHGFQRDDLRDLWPFRDWVVRAMNADMPFNQFTLWQLAGDLLPATDQPDALIATGFHRAAATNVEAGTDQEEGRINQVFDRVNTTAAVWLGSTLECAQCHNHKYDPFTQKEYYELFAYFNNTAYETAFSSPKSQAALKFTGPFFKVPVPAHEPRRVAAQLQAQRLGEEIAARSAALRNDPATWDQSVTTRLATATATHPLVIAGFTSTAQSAYRLLPDNSLLLLGPSPDQDTYILTIATTLTDITGFKLETLTDPSLPATGPGRAQAPRPNFILNGFDITATTAGLPPTPVPLLTAHASFSQAKFSVDNLLQSGTTAKTGWGISPQFQREHSATFTTAHPVGSSAGTTFTFTLPQNFGGGRTIGRLRISAITGTTTTDALPAEIAAILRTPATGRTAQQVATVHAYRLKHDSVLSRLKAEQSKVTAELNALQGPSTLIMQELPEPRPAFVLNRGNFLEPGERVTPQPPAILRPRPSEPQTNRLDLARWLIDPENPLVARVTVNRWWAEFFGRGLVTTPEDFGLKGDAPTHPELLDWLAVEFVAGGWSMKRIHKLITLSATYRQSSRLTAEHLALDDQNRWISRGPRFRLDAEAIRDNALAAAGLLSLKMGGPPVRPMQPAGLWDNKVGGDKITYEVSAGEDRHRRGIYTVWKRASPYPSFMNFDATARTTCTLRRSRSNTPLQALTLLNDPVYVEAAAALAQRIVTDQPNATVPARLDYAFRLCLTRHPQPAELAALHQLFNQQRAAHADERVAWQAVATALLNLDEMITKG